MFCLACFFYLFDFGNTHQNPSEIWTSLNINNKPQQKSEDIMEIKTIIKFSSHSLYLFHYFFYWMSVLGTIRTSFLAGSTTNVTWHLAYAHRVSSHFYFFLEYTKYPRMATTSTSVIIVMVIVTQLLDDSSGFVLLLGLSVVGGALVDSLPGSTVVDGLSVGSSGRGKLNVLHACVGCVSQASHDCRPLRMQALKSADAVRQPRWIAPVLDFCI